MSKNVSTEAQRDYSKGNNVLTGTVAIREAIPRLKAKHTITLNGFGKVVSGLFFVEKVTHSFSRSGYIQTLDVSRDGFGDSVQLTKVKNTKPTPPNKDVKPQGDHKIVKGDTLWWISDKYLGDPLRWKEIADLNKIDYNKRDEYRLRIGRVIQIPPK